MSINRFICMGHLGADPEIRYSPNGAPVATVSVATNSRSKDRQTGEVREITQWHRLVAFDKRAEIIRDHCSKGDKVYFEAYHRTRKFVDQETRKDRWVDEFVINLIELGTKRGEAADPGHDDFDETTAVDDGGDFPAV